MSRSLRGFWRGVAAALAMLVSGAVLAQAYPAKPIRLIFPFPPGGPTDLLGRAVAQKLSDQMGQQVVADNRPGAGGNLGLELAAKAQPDGYSLVLSSPLVAISDRQTVSAAGCAPSQKASAKARRTGSRRLYGEVL